MRKKGGFVKGDPRINRNGRPRSFDFVRDLGQKLGAEIDPEEKKIRAEVALLKLYKDDPAKFIEIAYGKVPDKVIMSGDPDNQLIIKIIEVKQ